MSQASNYPPGVTTADLPGWNDSPVTDLYDPWGLIAAQRQADHDEEQGIRRCETGCGRVQHPDADDSCAICQLETAEDELTQFLRSHSPMTAKGRFDESVRLMTARNRWQGVVEAQKEAGNG